MPKPGTSERQDESPSPREHPIAWYRQSTHPAVVFSRDLLTGIGLVVLLAVLLFAVSGVWPPLVAVESGSMDPHINKGDLVLVVDTDRYTPAAATADGIVTYETGTETGHKQFGNPGSVIVFQPDGSDGTPIIHRAHLYVEEGDNWVQRADQSYLGGASTCEETPFCPAPYDGYVTKGDANAGYDVVQGQTALVKAEWVRGKAAARIPYLGCLRLAFQPGPGCWQSVGPTEARVLELIE